MAGTTQDVRLLETMKVEGGRIALLARHMERLKRSADRLYYSCNISDIQRSAEAMAAAQVETVVARLLVAPDGSHEIERRPMPPEGRPEFLRMSGLHANPGDEGLFHKTTARSFYEEARAGLPEEADALIVNARGEVTETTILNVAFLRDGKWVTPKLQCGLLPGAMRAELLARGEIVEGVIRAEELVDGELVRCFNAVRGVMDVPFRK